MPSIFAPALEDLENASLGWLGPQSFQDYLAQHNLGSAKTATKISVQDLGSLDNDLRQANVMVFRLGCGIDRNSTQFALVKARQSIEEFFLRDDLATGEAQTFVPDVSVAELFPFELLGTLTETGAVNLAIAAGLLGHSLGCDEPFPRVAPATGASTYDFIVKPDARFSELEWHHRRGQVEIDTVFLGRREGRRILFVVEAKHGAPSERSSLAKTKLAYACSAIATKRVPLDIPIVPVYLRAWESEGRRRIRFSVKECGPWDRERAYVSGLETVSTKLFEMNFG